MRLWRALGAILWLGLYASAQQPETPAANPTHSSQASNILGPGDVITIHASEAEEISEKPLRITSNGDITLPMVGKVHAGGLTAEELEGELTNRLKTYIKDPEVWISVPETRSQAVTVVGAVNTPGVRQLEGRKTLLEVLALAGGIKDDAGFSIEITRRLEWGPIPLPNAMPDSSGQFSMAAIPVYEILTTNNPAVNIEIMPNDVISVPRGEMVYVIGDVIKPGSIVLGGQRAVSVIQAIAIASGVTKTAKSTQAKILRLTPGSTSRTEILVNLKAMLAGKSGDVTMLADDILFVPTSIPKDIGYKTIEALGGAAATGVIYRLP